MELECYVITVLYFDNFSVAKTKRLTFSSGCVYCAVNMASGGFKNRVMNNDLPELAGWTSPLSYKRLLHF
jgi:hypothetical protein